MKQRIIQQLKNSSGVLVASHINPDGDAIGSLTAMGMALESMGVRTLLHNESPIPAVYRFLPAVDRIRQRLDADGIDGVDTAVILDCGDLPRIGEAAALLGDGVCIVNIDHHITNTAFGDLQLIDAQACATTEILFDLLKSMAVPFTRDVATSIYTGIVTDTGSFRFSNTNRAAFSICEEMVRLGVTPYEVARHLYGTYSLGRIKLLNRALDSIEISQNGRLSMMTLTDDMLEETGTHPEDADGLINYARRIEDVKIAALIQEQRYGKSEQHNGSQKYHVSLRSDGSVDVASIAAGFGGGGHTNAAGFCIETTLSELKATIVEISKTI